MGADYLLVADAILNRRRRKRLSWTLVWLRCARQLSGGGGGTARLTEQRAELRDGRLVKVGGGRRVEALEALDLCGGGKRNAKAIRGANGMR